MTTITGSDSTTVRIAPDGTTVVEHGCAWCRLFRAIADLFLAGEIDIDEFSNEEGHWSTVFRGGRAYRREIACPIAGRLLNAMALTWMEPGCACDPLRDPRYIDPTCKHPEPTDDDRRERLRELMGL